MKFAKARMNAACEIQTQKLFFMKPGDFLAVLLDSASTPPPFSAK